MWSLWCSALADIVLPSEAEPKDVTVLEIVHRFCLATIAIYLQSEKVTSYREIISGHRSPGSGNSPGSRHESPFDVVERSSSR
ncbi:hypothetical protein NPIL_691601 [Nephila pilipes]|uniref:Uncharacterized protein n=1 Tax=Nephila pilipes TaxID=299642 RepID=A0A8X6QWW7_NEPPI|nr:hypothetical protein NPIL_691601 [Nephila pilipes]